MGLPQVPSGCNAEEVAASLGTFVQSAPKIASISNYELNLLAGEDLGNHMQVMKESHTSNMCKDGKSNIQKLKNNPMEQIGRLSVNVGQTMQNPTSRTVGFPIRALTSRVNGYGGNGYSSTVFNNVTKDATEASESQVRKPLLSPLNGMLLADHFESSSKGGGDSYNALILEEYKKVRIGNNNNILSMIWSTPCFQEFTKSSCNDPNVNQIVSSHRHSHFEHEEPWSYKHFRPSAALNNFEETTKIRSQTVALSIPQKKVSSPPFPLSPLGKKSSGNEKLGVCRDIHVMLDNDNVTSKGMEQSLDRTHQGILSATEMLSKSQVNSNSMQQKSDLFASDNIIDMKEYLIHPASFPPQHAKLSGNVSRQPIRRSLVGSFEESLLSGRLLSGKVSQVRNFPHIWAFPFGNNFLVKLS